MSNNYQNNIQYPRANTPNSINRSNFQAPVNINIATKSKGAIQIQKSQKSAIKIDTQGSDKKNIVTTPPQVERATTPNPVISISNPNRPNSHPYPIHQTEPIDPKRMNMTFNPNPQIPQMQPPNKMSQPIFAPPVSANSIMQPNIQPIVSQPKPISMPQTDAFNRLSLLSFVSSFEDEKSFNETDLEGLGLDLKCQEPLLPMLHSVLSNAPLLDHSRYPTPECYSKIQQNDKASDKISLFPPQTLLFIFYTYPRDPLQIQAAQELIDRKWIYDEELEEWRDPDRNVWSVDQWKAIEENQEGDINDPMYMNLHE